MGKWDFYIQENISLDKYTDVFKRDCEICGSKNPNKIFKCFMCDRVYVTCSNCEIEDDPCNTTKMIKPLVNVLFDRLTKRLRFYWEPICHIEYLNKL